MQGHLPWKQYMPFVAANTDNQFVGKLIQLHIIFGDKRQFQAQVVVTIFFANS